MMKPSRTRVHSVPIESLRARAVDSGPRLAVSVRSSIAAEIAFPRPRINNIEMPAGRSALELPVVQPAPVVNVTAWEIPQAAARSCGEDDASVGSVPTPCKSGADGSMADLAGRDIFTGRLPGVLDATNTISRFPHTRRGLTPRQIGADEVESHLNEARAARGVLPDNANLLAVFRRIPAELIAQVRFDESRRLLLFRLVSCEGRRLTRVYDMAAVKDRSTGELHLVPHRSRNRTVVLS